MKIEALTRLRSMPIKQGDNYRNGEVDADAMLEEYAQWTVKATHGKQALVYDNRTGPRYALISFSGDAKSLISKIKSGKTLEEAGATSVDAFITLSRKNEVVAVWVHPHLKNKGYGKSLYQVAYANSLNGISSSDDLGTESLAVWISLYKANPEIQLDVYQHGLVPREDITIKGLEISMEGEEYELTDRNGPRFKFRWPK